MKILFGVLIVLALIVSLIFVKGYFDESTTATSLKAKIDSDSKNLYGLTAANAPMAGDITDLKAKQAKIRASIASEGIVIPDRMNTNDIVRSLFTAAQKFDVKIVPLTSTDWTAAKIMQGSYWVYRSQIKVIGTQSQIIDFLNYVQKSLYPTLVIEKLNMQQKIPITPVVDTSSSSASDSGPDATPIAPSVFTLKATDIYYDSATLVGNLTVLGDSPNVLVNFQYGEDTSYGKTTPAVSQTSPGIFTFHITGLWGPSVYHYRAVAACTDWVFGSDVMFVTLGSIPTPTSLVLPTTTPTVIPTETPGSTPTPSLPTADLTIAVYAK